MRLTPVAEDEARRVELDWSSTEVNDSKISDMEWARRQGREQGIEDALGLIDAGATTEYVREHLLAASGVERTARTAPTLQHLALGSGEVACGARYPGIVSVSHHSSVTCRACLQVVEHGFGGRV